MYYSADKQVDIIDVQDWHFTPAAVTLKKALGIPFTSSIESLEEHRSRGANSAFNMAIKSIEWLGMYEAERLLVKSDWMRNETIRIYKVPPEKVKIVPFQLSSMAKEVLENYRDVLGEDR